MAIPHKAVRRSLCGICFLLKIYFRFLAITTLIVANTKGATTRIIPVLGDLSSFPFPVTSGEGFVVEGGSVVFSGAVVVVVVSAGVPVTSGAVVVVVVDSGAVVVVVVVVVVVSAGLSDPFTLTGSISVKTL